MSTIERIRQEALAEIRPALEREIREAEQIYSKRGLQPIQAKHEEEPAHSGWVMPEVRLEQYVVVEVADGQETEHGEPCRSRAEADLRQAKLRTEFGPSIIFKVKPITGGSR